MLLLISENWKEAEQLCEEVISEGKTNFVGHSLFVLGWMFEEGKGKKTDLEESKKYYLLAVQKFHPIAAVRLAAYYENGNSVSKDMKRAIELYEFAAKFVNFYTHF